MKKVEMTFCDSNEFATDEIKWIAKYAYNLGLTGRYDACEPWFVELWLDELDNLIDDDEDFPDMPATLRKKLEDADGIINIYWDRHLRNLNMEGN